MDVAKPPWMQIIFRRGNQRAIAHPKAFWVAHRNWLSKNSIEVLRVTAGGSWKQPIPLRGGGISMIDINQTTSATLILNWQSQSYTPNTNPSGPLVPTTNSLGAFTSGCWKVPCTNHQCQGLMKTQANPSVMLQNHAPMNKRSPTHSLQKEIEKADGRRLKSSTLWIIKLISHLSPIVGWGVSLRHWVNLHCVLREKTAHAFQGPRKANPIRVMKWPRRSQTVVSWDVDEKGKQQCLFRCPSRKAKPASTACLFKTLDAFPKKQFFHTAGKGRPSMNMKAKSSAILNVICVPQLNDLMTFLPAKSA